MTTELKTLDQLLQDGSGYQLVSDAISPLTRIVEALDQLTLSANGISTDFAMVQIFVGIVALIIIGITLLPFGATPSSIQACQMDTNQKLLKTGGVVIIVMTSLSAILFIEVLRLSEILSRV